MPKFQWKGDSKLCIPTLQSGKVMPGAVFEMDDDCQKLAGVQKLMRDGLIVPYTETPAEKPAEIPAGAPIDTGNGGDAAPDGDGGGSENQPEKPKPQASAYKNKGKK